jgi:hydrogenase expression/formation protein HypE
MSAEGPSCPAPFAAYDRVVLAHGGGGRATLQLIETLFRRAFDSDELREAHDGAVLALEGPTAVCTDAFTVRPLFFEGGDIGSLAVHGIVNDLACCGAITEALTVSFILEEGLPLATLERVARSLGEAARACNARVVAGDTKVVERGRGDGVYIACTGLGPVRARLAPSRIRPGQRVILSGSAGEHGIAVLMARGDIAIGSSVKSDSREIASIVHRLIDADVALSCARDPTRGGVATALCELARTAKVGVRIDEGRVAVSDGVRDACELLGLDPLYVACEGRVLLFVDEPDAERALAIVRAFDAQAAVIGEVCEDHDALVTAVGPFGGERVLDMLSGEQLPRIC